MIKFFFVLLALVAANANASSSTVSCNALLSGKIGDGSWRSARTHAFKNGDYVATSPARELQIKNLENLQWKELNDRDVPMMYIVPAEGVLTKELKHATGDDNDGTIERIRVGGLSTAELPVTVLAPISGHFGDGAVAAAVKTDRYTIEATDSSGRMVQIIKDARSLGFITHSEGVIPLEKGKIVTLRYERTNSGSGGYRQGRTVEILWDPDTESSVQWDKNRGWIDQWKAPANQPQNWPPAN